LFVLKVWHRNLYSCFCDHSVYWSPKYKTHF
jgi:hypothetical protein